MKIAWFTPFNQKSAIGKVSKVICEHLSKSHKVDLWVIESKEEQLKTSIKTHIYVTENFSEDLSEYNFIIYNFGNNCDFHGSIYEISKKYPGVSIIHDYTLHIFFDDYFRKKGQQDRYLSLVEENYGTEAANLALDSIKGLMTPSLSRSDLGTQMPLFEPVITSSIGVFVHSLFSLNIVRDKFLLPTEFSYLPYPIDHIGVVDKSKIKSRLCLPDDKIIIVSTGIVHPVKRIHVFLEAWGKAANKDDFFYCVIGDYGSDYFATLVQIADSSKIADKIRFLGWADEIILEDYLNAADLALNLRFPNTEGCSYSAIEQLSHGLPLICTNSGFFKELPDSIAMKIALDNEVTQLSLCLEALDKSSKLGKLSDEARRFSRANFSVEKYCSTLSSFLDDLVESPNHFKYFEDYLSWVSEQMKLLIGGYDQQLAFQIDRIFSGSPKLASDRKVLGLWFAFNYKVELRREGITRFANSFARALIDEADYDIEIWCYEMNRSEIEVSFETILQDPKYKMKVKIVTEKNYYDSLRLKQTSSSRQIRDLQSVCCEADDLYLIANKHSNACDFLIPIIYLSNALKLDKRILVAAHDLQTLVDYESFLGKHSIYIHEIRKTFESARAFVRKGAFLFSNSKFVLENQIKHYLPELPENNCGYVYLPTSLYPVSDLSEDNENFRSRFKIKKPYIFLATQLRPYKNVTTLLKACLLVPDLVETHEIILTGNLENDESARAIIKGSSLREAVRTVASLSEKDLQLFYLNCDIVVVPTFFEGGFPWQAIEGMFFNKPVIISDIPITKERLTNEGFSREQTSFMVFDPNSAKELSEKIVSLLKDKNIFLEKQKPISDKITAYDWGKAIKKYVKLLDL